MRKIIAKELKIKFIETLNELDEFSYEEGNPFLIKIGAKKYFVFLKNLSSAYFKNKDITRVQLPYSDRFLKIFKAAIPFVILGYDVDNDVFVSWNPKNVKERLNAKSNVSLYSRHSLQVQVNENKFKCGYLTNGEKIISFKRSNLLDFFYNINELFNDQQLENEVLNVKTVNEPAVDFFNTELVSITDNFLLEQLYPLLNRNQVLQAVEITSNYYRDKYKNMKFKDWYKLVSDLYRKLNK